MPCHFHQQDSHYMCKDKNNGLSQLQRQYWLAPSELPSQSRVPFETEPEWTINKIERNDRNTGEIGGETTKALVFCTGTSDGADWE